MQGGKQTCNPELGGKAGLKGRLFCPPQQQTTVIARGEDVCPTVWKIHHIGHRKHRVHIGIRKWVLFYVLVYCSYDPMWPNQGVEK